MANGDGSVIGSLSRDGRPRIWDGATGDELAADQLSGFAEQRLSSLQFAPGGRSIVTLDRAGSAVAWDVDKPDRRPLAEGVRVARVEMDSDPGSAILLVPNAAAGANACAQLLTANAASAGQICAGAAAIGAARLSQGGRFVVSVTQRTIDLWDASNGQLVVERPADGSDSRAWPTADGRLLVTMPFGVAGHVWDVKSGAQVADLRRYDRDGAARPTRR